MRACVHERVCVCACMCACVHAYMRACVHERACVCACVHVCATVCMCARVCVCASVHTKDAQLRDCVVEVVQVLTLTQRVAGARERLTLRVGDALVAELTDVVDTLCCK
jgi:hypothetical protein